MNSLTSTYRLSNGYEIPVVGFGTWQTPDGDVAVSSVKEALAAGYRHIDTAQGYKNEESVGQAIKESGIPREEIFLTTKLWNANHSYELVMSSFEESLKKLKQIIQICFDPLAKPCCFRDNWEQANADTWRAFEELYEAGKIKAIGVSNFLPHHLDTLAKQQKLCRWSIKFSLHQANYRQLQLSMQKHDMILEAYSPLGTGKIFDVPEMKQIAEAHDKTIAQVALRWSLQHEFLPLPKSVTPSRIKENTELFDFELTEEEMKQIDQLDGVVGKAKDPDTTQF